MNEENTILEGRVYVAGSRGYSAYEVAVINGFEGTEAEWLESLQGETGPAGPDGITPTIGDNENWYMGDVDTGKPSRGATGADGADGFSPVVNISKEGTVTTIEITDSQTTHTATINDGADGADGVDGQDGRDGYVQYTAGDNITIDENNVISASGGDSSDILVLKLDDQSDEAKEKVGRMITEHYQKGLIAIIQGKNPVPIYNAISTNSLTYVFSQSIYALRYDTTASNRRWYEVTTAGTWNDGVYTCTTLTYYQMQNLAEATYVLGTNNTASYTPSGNYNPATKKYVDDSIASAITDALGGSY